MAIVCDDGTVEFDCKQCSTPVSYVRPPGTRGRIRGFCSAECKETRGRRRQNALVTCRACGKSFSPRYHNRANTLLGHGTLCSMTCRATASKVYPNRAAYKAAGEKRRKARLRGVEVEQFADLEIFERDNWTCGLCFKKVDRRLKFPDRMSASLDHIVPVADGGPHTRVNVQCSHWICNARKSSGAGGQMRLFG